MAKKQAGGNQKVLLNDNNRKRTTIGDPKLKTSSLNKHKKRNYKAYRGQGR